MGRRIFWTRDRRRILADLDATLVVDSAHRITHGTAPLFAELGFGFIEESIDAVEIALPDGRTLRVRGRIDRVDLGRDGTIHVVDYKTGSYHQGYQDLLERRPRRRGHQAAAPDLRPRRSRRARHAEAPVRAEYWFVTDAGAASPAAATRSPTTVLERTIEVLDVIVRGVDDGVFPPHPPALSTFFRIACHVCDPDGLGTAELRKQWDAQARRPRAAGVRRPGRATRGAGRRLRVSRAPTSRAPCPCRRTDTGPSSLTTMIVAVGSSKL